jgi:hypothetical protein
MGSCSCRCWHATRLQWKDNSSKLAARRMHIDRRKFVPLLSVVPFIGKRMLVICQKPKDKPREPPGYERCDVCNEYNGTTDASNLSWNSSPPPTGEISVTCKTDPSLDYEQLRSGCK